MQNTNDKPADQTTVPAQEQPAQESTSPNSAGPSPNDSTPPAAEDVHAPIPADQYGLNTPTKRSSSSGVWNVVKRLRGSLNNADGDGTHVCLVELKSGAIPGAATRMCNTILKLHKSKATIQTGSQSWLTTRAAEHLAKEHPIDSVIGVKFAAEAKQRQDELAEKVMSFGMPGKEGGVVGGVMFTLTRKEKALSSQAQWYTYSTMHISKSEFDSPYFKRMLAGGEDPDKTLRET